jgi:hypothetical protein
MAQTKRIAGLKSALEEAAGSRATGTAKAPPPATNTAAAERTGSRNGKIHVGAWLPPEYKTSLRMIQIKTGGKGGPERDFQELMAEALNDLFAKYDVPTVNE